MAEDRPEKKPQKKSAGKKSAKKAPAKKAARKAAKKTTKKAAPPAERRQRYCSHCGEGLSAAARFCPACGEAIDAATPQDSLGHGQEEGPEPRAQPDGRGEPEGPEPARETHRLAPLPWPGPDPDRRSEDPPRVRRPEPTWSPPAHSDAAEAVPKRRWGRVVALSLLGLFLFVMVIGLLAEDPNGTDETPDLSDLVREPGPPPPELAAACQAYNDAVDDYIDPDEPVSDDEHAARLDAIASEQAVGTALEPLIRAEADAFRRGVMNIDSSPIRAACDPTMPPPDLEEEPWLDPERQQRFLGLVHDRDPRIQEEHPEDVIASGEAVCLILLTAEEPVPRMLLNNVAATARIDDDDASPIVDAAVQVFCPQRDHLVGQ